MVMEMVWRPGAASSVQGVCRPSAERPSKVAVAPAGAADDGPPAGVAAMRRRTGVPLAGGFSRRVAGLGRLPAVAAGRWTARRGAGRRWGRSAVGSAGARRPEPERGPVARAAAGGGSRRAFGASAGVAGWSPATAPPASRSAPAGRPPPEWPPETAENRDFAPLGAFAW